MNLCSDDHEEVCYEGRKCPACDIAETLQEEIDNLASTVDALQREVDEMEGGQLASRRGGGYSN